VIAEIIVRVLTTVLSGKRIVVGALKEPTNYNSFNCRNYGFTIIRYSYLNGVK
jgi:hypothetical protein